MSTFDIGTTLGESFVPFCGQIHAKLGYVSYNDISSIPRCCCCHSDANFAAAAGHPAEVRCADGIVRLRQTRCDDPDARRRETAHRNRYSKESQECACYYDAHALQRLEAHGTQRVAAYARTPAG